MHTLTLILSPGGFFSFSFFFNCILQQHIPLADSTTGMFFHLLDFSGLILWSVAIAPGAKALSDNCASGEDFNSQELEARRTVKGLSGQLSQYWEASPKFWLPNNLFHQIHLFSVSVNTPFVYIVFSLCCTILGRKNLPRVTRQWQSRLLVQHSSLGLAGTALPLPAFKSQPLHQLVVWPYTAPFTLCLSFPYCENREENSPLLRDWL